MPKMLFHYPGRLFSELDSGEKKRPVKMLQAFRDIGYDVTLIAGSYRERQKIFRQAANGSEKYDFLYSENSTMPLRLSCGSRIPHFFGNPDFGVFEYAAQRKIPSGVFYRDIYWRHPHFKKEIGRLKYCAAIPFYLEEIKFYMRSASVVFTPSERFAEALDRERQQGAPARLLPLYPAEEPRALPPGRRENSGPLKILYVGALRPPVYDISFLLQTIVRLPPGSAVLDIATRKDEAQFLPAEAAQRLAVKVHHCSGEDLAKLYHGADVFAMFFEDCEYRRLCMPLKLFEAVGFGLPIISSENNSAADFIMRNGIGWVTDKNNIGSLLRHLTNTRDEIAGKRDAAVSLRCVNTWKTRAEKAAEILLSARKKIKARAILKLANLSRLKSVVYLLYQRKLLFRHSPHRRVHRSRAGLPY